MNCLITTLRGVVDDPNMNKIGEVSFNTDTDFTVTPGSGQTCIVRTNGNYLYTDASQERVNSVSVSSLLKIYVTQECKVFIGNAYNVRQLFFSPTADCNIEILGMTSGVAYLSITGDGNANIGNLPTGLIRTSLRNCGFQLNGNYPDLLEIITSTSNTNPLDAAYIGSNCPVLQRLDTFDGKYTGDFDELGKCALVNIRATMGGSIEGFVRNARAKGRTSGSVECAWLGGEGLTFNGAEVERIGTPITLSWDATTITYNGVTITA